MMEGEKGVAMIEKGDFRWCCVRNALTYNMLVIDKQI